MNGKQVAVVVPTTLLARQHYATFTERFKGLPLRLAQASRLVGRKAIDAVKATPALAVTAQQAVVTHPDIIGVMEIGPGIQAAREASVVMQNAERPFWYNPAFAISFMLLAFPVMLCVDVFYVHPTLYDGTLRVQIVTGVLAVIMMIGGFWLGSSLSSQRKTEIAAEQGRAP